jgi:hypothetical protein
MLLEIHYPRRSHLHGISYIEKQWRDSKHRLLAAPLLLNDILLHLTTLQANEQDFNKCRKNAFISMKNV